MQGLDPPVRAHHLHDASDPWSLLHLLSREFIVKDQASLEAYPNFSGTFHAPSEYAKVSPIGSD